MNQKKLYKKKKNRRHKKFKKKSIKKALKKIFLKTKYFRKRNLKYDRKLSIKITSNNIHCNLRNLILNKTILVGSATKYRVAISRKRLKKNTINVLRPFYRQAKRLLTPKGLIINLIGPKRLKRKIIKFSKILRKFKIKKIRGFTFFRPLIIKIQNKKCFNGCRPAKKKRKKRKNFRIFR